MNRYLEKIAGFSKLPGSSPKITKNFLDKVIKFSKDVAGVTHNDLAQEAKVLSAAQAQNRTASMALNEAKIAKRNMEKARLATGLTVAGVGTAGFLGLHKYHQHKDDAIMAKINSMYADQPN